MELEERVQVTPALFQVPGLTEVGAVVEESKEQVEAILVAEEEQLTTVPTAGQVLEVVLVLKLLLV